MGKAFRSKTGAAARASCLTLQKGRGWLPSEREEVVVCIPSALAVGTVLTSQVMLPTLIPSVLGTLKAAMGDASVV